MSSRVSPFDYMLTSDAAHNSHILGPIWWESFEPFLVHVSLGVLAYLVYNFIPPHYPFYRAFWLFYATAFYVVLQIIHALTDALSGYFLAGLINASVDLIAAYIGFALIRRFHRKIVERISEEART